MRRSDLTSGRNHSATILRHSAIQMIAFLFIALTPFAGWIALPLYAMLNPLLAFLAGVTVLGTSKQEGRQLVIECSSWSYLVLQIWYWMNIGLAIPCALCCICLIAAWFSQ